MFGSRSAARWTGCSTGSRAVSVSGSRRSGACSTSNQRRVGKALFSVSAPAIDVTEDEKTYKITAELPGLDQKNLDVSVSGDMLTLKGEKHHEKEEKDKNHYLVGARLRIVSAQLCAAGERRSRQDHCRSFQGRTDDYPPQDGRSPETAKEDRGQSSKLIQCMLGAVAGSSPPPSISEHGEDMPEVGNWRSTS